MSGGSLIIELSWPDKVLWPNGRAHHMVVARFKKAARTEAGWATKYVLSTNSRWSPDEPPIPIHIEAHAKPVGPLPDRDGVVGSVKAHLDGISDALGINDRDFAAPTVSFADRCPRGKLIVSVG